MTDKEKLDNLVAEIERLYHQSLVDEKIRADRGLHSASVSYGKSKACKELLSFTDSMQEEPKECMYSKGNYTDEDRKVLCEDCKEKCAYAIAGVISTNAQIKKEPVSDDLEQAIDNYLATYFGGEKEKQDWPFLKKMAIHFAAWQKEQLMAKAVDGVVHHHGNCKVASVYYNDPDNVPMAYYIPSEGVSEGDVVKIITIKED